MRPLAVALIVAGLAVWLRSQVTPLPTAQRRTQTSTETRLQSGPVTVYTAPAMRRIGRSDPPDGPGNITLWAARGEYEAFQIVINGGDSGIRSATVSVSDLEAPGSAIISAANATLYREHYVLVTKSSPDHGGANRPLPPGWFADALIPFQQTDDSGQVVPVPAAAPFAVKPHQNQPIWIDWFVPTGSAAGLYAGTATVTADGKRVDIPIELNVWRFTLPQKSSLQSSFGMHEPFASDFGTQRLLVTHKLMPFLTSPDNLHRLRLLGLNIAGLGLTSDSSRSTCTMGPAPAISKIAGLAANTPAGVPRYIYTADEIDPCPNLFGRVKQWAQNMHQAGVLSLATITPNPTLYDDGSGTGRSAVDIWVVAAGMYDSAPDRVAEVMRKGDQVWSYTALVQDSYSPKWEIDFAPIIYRIQAGFLNQSLGLTGLLYWRVDLFTSQPWSDVNSYTEGNFAFPGEGMLVYPGPEMGLNSPAPSMRLKWLRDGVEDYEYIQAAKTLGKGDWALGVSRTVAADWSRWTQNPDLLEAARLQIGQELDRASKE
jgi:hypothetical protein